MEKNTDWRIIRGEWHFIEHFPEANQFGSVCGLYRPYGLFDKISKEMPKKDVCDTCKLTFQEIISQNGVG